MISITSAQNPRVKRVVKLNDRRARDDGRRDRTRREIGGQRLLQAVVDAAIAIGREVHEHVERLEGPGRAGAALRVGQRLARGEGESRQ